ncbi:uncharacterized protein LOC112551772 [Alligator sinensis]|uniref:Uncharacterized protein LOC112551772 n=1 Tax=Alligator sinensis TaxID=38654 RepID=A0A3Q0HIY4_ALLSI|nr:uncharacterized protein LOC112551772 [Alligator sinensis]
MWMCRCNLSPRIQRSQDVFTFPSYHVHGTGLSRTPLHGSSTSEESVHTAGRLSLPRLPGADTRTRPAAQEESVGSRPRALGLAVRGEPGFIFWDIPSSLPPSSGEELSNVAPTSEVFLTWIRSKVVTAGFAARLCKATPKSSLSNITHGRNNRDRTKLLCQRFLHLSTHQPLHNSFPTHQKPSQDVPIRVAASDVRSALSHEREPRSLDAASQRHQSQSHEERDRPAAFCWQREHKCP